MTKPIAWLVPEPMPRETMSGIMPATNANVVIRIGRSRSRLAWTIASCVRQPGLLQLVGVVDLQNRVLLHDAEQHQQAERREDVQRLPEDDDRQQREGQRQRQRQQDRDRVQPRLELRRQNQIHEDQRQHEREHEVLRRAPELLRAAGERAAVVAAGVEPVELGQHRVLHFGLRRRRQQVGRTPSPGAGAPSRLMSDGAVPGAKSATLSSDTLPSRDDGTVSAADRLPASMRFSAARAQVHFVLLAAFVVGRHLIAADEEPQRFGRVADLHAEVGRLRPIDLHRELRLADVQRRVEVDDARAAS